MTTHVARILDQARRDAGLTFVALHEKTGFAKSALQNWLDGSRSPAMSDFLQLCVALGRNPGRVLDEAAEAARTQKV